MKNIKNHEDLIMSNNDNLVEIEKELLLKINNKKVHLEEINNEKNLITNKIQEIKKINADIRLLENIITKESGDIVNIKKSVSIKNKENSIIKNKFENFRIEFR